MELTNPELSCFMLVIKDYVSINEDINTRCISFLFTSQEGNKSGIDKGRINTFILTNRQQTMENISDNTKQERGKHITVPK